MVPRLGRYELVAALGRGGMAEVFDARLSSVPGFAKRLAIKRILPHLATDPAFVAMLFNEAKLAAGLSHANICQVFELARDGDELFMVMEFLDGVTWDRVVARGAIEPRLAAGVLVQAAEGLQHAHDHGVIHRDVSPHNLFITGDGTCKLVDFGVAKALTEGKRTRTGVLKGKLPYMSPEQIRGETLDARADVFALGAVAWESLVGKRLFDRDTEYQVWKAIEEEPIPLATALRPELPHAIDDVLAGALERDRTRRFASARAFATALTQVAGMMLPREIATALAGPIAEQRTHHARSSAAAANTDLSPGAADAGDRAGTSGDRSAASTVDDKHPHMALRDAPAVVKRRRRIAPLIGLAAGVAAAAVLAFVMWPRDGAPEPVAVSSALPAPQDGAATTTPTPPEPPAPPAATKPAPTSATPVRPGGHPVRPPARPAPAAPAAPHPAGAPPPTSTTTPTPDEQAIQQITALGGAGAGSQVRDALATLRAVRTWQVQLANGALSVASTTPATISIDGTQVGATPLTHLSLSPGAHHITAVLADGRSSTRDVTIDTSREATVNFAW
jgi:hypothetical protein